MLYHQKAVILEAEQEQSQAYLHGMSKAAQHKLRYALYGQVGSPFHEKVFTKTGAQPSETVKLYLGLKDLVPEIGRAENLLILLVPILPLTIRTYEITKRTKLADPKVL